MERGKSGRGVKEDLPHAKLTSRLAQPRAVTMCTQTNTDVNETHCSPRAVTMYTQTNNVLVLV